MLKTFSEVLKIVNGRNQKAVESENGLYPIYGSGGIMGYAYQFLCPGNTVILGRKGNINAPLFSKVPFWNVDTAFGLVPDQTALLPEYLYYFCVNYNFNKLNTTVTIPSLTKANLLKVRIDLPDLDTQRSRIKKISLVDKLIESSQQLLIMLDKMVKSRFSELFEAHEHEFKKKNLIELSDIVSGITKGRKVKTTDLHEVPYLSVSNVKDGYITLNGVKRIKATTEEIEKYRLQVGDVLMTEGGDPDKVGRGAVLEIDLDNCIHQNHVFRVRLDQTQINPVYFSVYLQTPQVKKYFLRCAKQTTGIASINMKQLSALPVTIPPLELQNRYVAELSEINKSKVDVESILNKLVKYTLYKELERLNVLDTESICRSV